MRRRVFNKSDSKCSLKIILEVVVFPKVKKLVQKGREFENAQVIFQGDRDGPHTYAEFQKIPDKYFSNEKLIWSP